MTACRLNSINQIKQIAYLVQTYRQNHNGQNPERLSQLIDYSPTMRVFYLFCGNTYMVQNTNSQRDFVDLFSPYRLLALNDKRIVICEQPKIWPDETMGYCVIGADPTNVVPEEVGRFPAIDFESRLLNGFREGAKSGSVWRVQYAIEGQDDHVQISMTTSNGIEQKTVSTPFTSPIYEFYKFQHVSFSAQHQSGSITAILLVNGKSLVQDWNSGTNTTIDWIVGSSSSY